MATAPGNGVIEMRDQYLAFFSTGGGRYIPRRYDPETPPTKVVRSDLEADKHAYIKLLRGRWPKECSSIFAMSSQGHPHWQLHWFFDEHDFHVQGGRFLYDVISTIQKENEDAVRAYVDSWNDCNQSRYATFAASVEQLTVETAFSKSRDPRGTAVRKSRRHV